MICLDFRTKNNYVKFLSIEMRYFDENLHYHGIYDDTHFGFNILREFDTYNCDINKQ